MARIPKFRTVNCPRCSAGIGQPCITAKGNLLRGYHQPRITAYYKEWHGKR